MKIAAVSFIMFATALLTSCMVFSAQGTPSTSVKAPLRIDIGKAAEDGSSVRISGGALSGAVLSGVARKENASGWTVSLESLHWFNNWKNGWTDATFVADGSFEIDPSPSRAGSAWTVAIKSRPEIDAPYVATIRYYDQYLNGSYAFQQFTDRFRRIQAYTKFLRHRFGDSWYGSPERRRRFLFPEVYGYDRPPALHHATAEEDGILWNTDHTKQQFPKELWPLRDSGTMLRDYKESPGLWDLTFYWDELWSTTITARVSPVVSTK